MDFQYTFRQAHTDHLEDAGVERYRQHLEEGYIIEKRETDTPKRKSMPQQMNRVALVFAQLLVK